MMIEFLRFHLYGPMAAWGEIAVGEHRHVQSYPSKSALLGLLAAALGIERTQEAQHQALAEDVGCAVLLESRGVPLTDFHTTQVPKATHCKGRFFASRREELAAAKPSDLSTILSRRDYRCDALARVVIWVSNPASTYTLASLLSALERPRFPLYLGRKSCPLAAPLQAQLCRCATVLEALEEGSSPLHETFKKWLPLMEHTELFWDADAQVPMGIQAGRVLMRRDAPLSRKRWQFAVRRACHATLGQKE